MLKAQVESNYKSGEFIVQISHSDSLHVLLSSENLKIKEVLSERFSIYLIKTLDNYRSNTEILDDLSKYSFILNKQNNHSISLRNHEGIIPNDSLFNKQWSLLNTGQVSGYEGADTEATLAWEITTGGVTAHGDTIVIAIVDGGCDLDHEDLNLFKNNHEIPGNGIDDDNNGYIDDYDGWNAYNNSGVIPDNLHGVHVSGIAGAIANNEAGIAGVNWGSKIMPIAGESTYESIVVKAMSYIYVMREIYDTTNGARGAFIVAQNNSFGIDKGQPEDYPIWEAMYDSLGSIGILNFGATANRAWNIDSVGDVPTAFETPYMVSVTNTTNKDLLNGGAAWGLNTIDLGAPGTMIWSLGLNNTYRASSGTSMATPHVAGAAALLMAAADSSFIADYKANPGDGILQIKEFLLNGTEPLPDLEGKTVTGGRLNLYNSVNLLLNSPELDVNVNSISEELAPNTTLERLLLISNIGGGELSYELFVAEQPDWLILSSDSGVVSSGKTDTLIISLSTINIDTGNYSCNINISGDSFETDTIRVNLYVYDNTFIHETNNPTITIYPNPFNTKVKFELAGVHNDHLKLEILSKSGQLLFTKTQNDVNGVFRQIWNGQNCPSGIYFYRLSDGNGVIKSGKFLKK